MELTEILVDSFRMLIDRPILFVPRLFSSALSSLLLVLFVARYIGVTELLVAFPAVAVIGAFTPVVVASMVEKEERENLLRKGIKDALKLWKPVIGFTLITIILAFIASLPLSLGMTATLLTANYLYLLTGLIVSLLILVAMSYAFYFVPISLVEEDELFNGMKKAFKTSNQNSKEVIMLTLFSFAVLISASLTTGVLRDIGLTVFFLGRLGSSIVSTYLLVISPNYYLSEAKKE